MTIRSPYAETPKPAFLPRPPIPAKLIRLGAALLELGLLVSVGVMFLQGAVQDPNNEGPTQIPIRVGVSVLPILSVALGHAVVSLRRPRRFAFMLAGALVCALGAACRKGLEPKARMLDALTGFVVGGLVMGFFMAVDDDTKTLLEGGAQPWREILVGAMFVMFGAMPTAIFGGFVIALPTILVGIAILSRAARYDASLAFYQKSIGAAVRVFLALLLGLMALGFLVVCPLMSLGLMPLR